MKARTQGLLVRAVSAHLAMGFGLGALLALALIAADTRNIFDAMTHGAAPTLALTVFVGLFGTMVGVGAALSGLIFTLMDER